jgi:cytochrome c peroxidase
VAQRLDDTIGVIDTGTLEMTDEIDLGGPEEITLLRRGEYMFNYAAISFQKQLSCNTCHPEHHVDGLVYDIAVDGGLGGNLVDNRTLRGITHTEPFKWSGKNPNLARQEGPRAAQLFFRSHGFEGPDRDAIVAFIESIPLQPNRHVGPEGELSASQQRGKMIFEREYTNDGRYIPVGNRCVTCHEPPYFTNQMSCDVGTRAYFDTDGKVDTPQLNNVGESAPYLHDGRCWSLEEIWTLYNPFDLHGAANDLTKQQLNDLIEYLKTF